MTKETHTSGGICFSLITLNYFATTFLLPYNFGYKILLISLYFHFAIIGSLFPDIDKKGSSISKMYPFLSKHFGTRFKHRGFTHSFLALALILLLREMLLYVTASNIILVTVSFSFLIGYSSHLLLDLTTTEGIEALSPCNFNFSIGRIKTGGTFEKYIRKLIKLINALLIIYNLSILCSSFFGINLIEVFLRMLK